VLFAEQLEMARAAHVDIGVVVNRLASEAVA